MMEKNMEAVRKGPWTEQEDVQLVFYVNLFGDRRWDFIAKVSGLKRTGKSCRLRWVNYLHPGLKRVKMTPHEERLVLDLHKKWGNRWSRIARKLPGRTDNEIKNYWRTHMRKKAQERKKGGAGAASPSSSSSSSCSSSYNSSSSSVICDNPANKAFSSATENKGRSFYDTGGKNAAPAGAPGQKKAVLEVVENTKVYSMDEIWKDIELSEEGSITVTSHTMGSLIWDFSPADSLWSMDEEASKTMMQQIGIHVVHSFPPNNNNNTTG